MSEIDALHNGLSKSLHSHYPTRSPPLCYVDPSSSDATQPHLRVNRNWRRYADRSLMGGLTTGEISAHRRERCRLPFAFHIRQGGVKVPKEYRSFRSIGATSVFALRRSQLNAESWSRWKWFQVRVGGTTSIDGPVGAHRPEALCGPIWSQERLMHWLTHVYDCPRTNWAERRTLC